MADINRSMSFSEPRRMTSSPPPTDLTSMACGRLERSADVAQCVIVSLHDMSTALEVDPPYDQLYGLLTCHHVLPTMDNSWKLVLGPTGREKHQLSRGRFLKLLSCCGSHGFWNPNSHVPQRGNRMAGLCPVRGDWTLAILQPAFAEEIKRGHEYIFPSITSYDQGVLNAAFQTRSCRLFERRQDGTILQHFVDIKCDISQPMEGRSQLENMVCSYRDMAVLRYPMTFLSTIKAGCSGAPIFCLSSSTSNSLQSLQLLGIHSSSPDLSESSDADQHGLAVPYILDLAIKDGASCSLTACLSFLNETIKWNKCLPLSIEKLTKHIVKHRTDLQGSNIPLEEKLKQIRADFELVDFIPGAFPEDIRKMKYQALKQNKEPSLLYMDLLCALFSCFEGYSATELGAAVGCDGAPVVERVEGVCQDLCILMNCLRDSRSSEDKDIIERGFQLWWNLLFFNIVDGPADTVLSCSEKYSILKEMRLWKMLGENVCVQRMFGNISVAYQSKMRRDAATQLKNCLAEQKTELEEEKVKEIEALKEKMAEVNNLQEELKTQNATQKENLTLHIKTLETKCEEQTLALEQYRQLEAEKIKLDVENEKMACQLTATRHELNTTKNELENERKKKAKFHIGSQKPQSHIGTTDGQREHPGQPEQDLSSPALCFGPLSQQLFWTYDVCEVLQQDSTLCKQVAKYFEKVKGASGGSWEHLISEVQCDLDKTALETLPVPDILLTILQDWRRRKEVNVGVFCEVSEKIGNLQVRARFDEVLQQCSQQESRKEEGLGTIREGSSYHFGWLQSQNSEQAARSSSQLSGVGSHLSGAESYPSMPPQWPGSNHSLVSSAESYKSGLSQRLGSDDSQRRRSDQWISSTNRHEGKLTTLLQQRAIDISHYMNPTEISPYLVQNKLLTWDQLNHLSSLSETTAKNMYIVQMMSSKGDKAIELFITCLRKTSDQVPAHEELANELEAPL